MSNEIVPVSEEQQIHEVVERLTPVKQIETSLAKFLQDTFVMAKEEDDYQKNIKMEIIKRLPDMKPSELIALATSASTNKNDLISKIMAPIAQLLTAAQQNELAIRQQTGSPAFQQTNIREVNNMAPSDVLLGLSSLFNMVNTMKTAEEAPKEDA
jgi:uncharacterized protein YktB (UPF0637 family)